MKAAIYKGIKQMACEERPKPGIVDGGDAIIRVVRACVCGSDLWFYRDGGKPVVKPGDFVIVPFPYSCGKCPVCKAGFESSCPHGGYFGDEDGMGCQAEYLRVPEAEGTLVVVPGDAKTFSDEMLASLLTLSDVMATGYHAAASAEVKPGDTAVVFGDGAVGLCAVLSAKLMGATRIISMSRHTDRQEIAKKFGATDFVEERGDEAVAKVLEMPLSTELSKYNRRGRGARMRRIGLVERHGHEGGPCRGHRGSGGPAPRRRSRYSRPLLPQCRSTRWPGRGAYL